MDFTNYFLKLNNHQEKTSAIESQRFSIIYVDSLLLKVFIRNSFIVVQIYKC